MRSLPAEQWNSAGVPPSIAERVDGRGERRRAELEQVDVALGHDHVRGVAGCEALLTCRLAGAERVARNDLDLGVRDVPIAERPAAALDALAVGAEIDDVAQPERVGQRDDVVGRRVRRARRPAGSRRSGSTPPSRSGSPPRSLTLHAPTSSIHRSVTPSILGDQTRSCRPERPIPAGFV